MKTVRVGSRDSVLAVAQAEILIKTLEASGVKVCFELVTMKTTGDMILDRTLDKIGGKGLFTKELERALVEGKIDICVHSYKDVPVEINRDLPIVALSPREDPRDALILPESAEPKSLEPDFKKPVGSSSARRRIQLERLYPLWKTEPVRGNVITRLRKLDEGSFGGLVLACAGVKRIGLFNRVSKIFSTEEILPAASQGILAVQGRRGENYDYLENFHSKTSEYISQAERSFIINVGGGCTSPSTAYAEINGSRIFLRGMFVNEATSQIYEGSAEGHLSEAEALGTALAKKLISQGGEHI